MLHVTAQPQIQTLEKPINDLFVRGSFNHFQRLAYVHVLERHRPIFSQQGYNIHIADRYQVAGGVRYRDSECNIRVHKIGVKLFGRLFDLSSIGVASLLLFEGCNMGAPSQAQVESREMEWECTSKRVFKPSTGAGLTQTLPRARLYRL